MTHEEERPAPSACMLSVQAAKGPSGVPLHGPLAAPHWQLAILFYSHDALTAGPRAACSGDTCSSFV